MSALVHRPLGQPIPQLPHAVSCSLPTLRDVIGYEEKDPAITAHLTSGYPRFVIHPFLHQVVAVLRQTHPALAQRSLWLCAGPTAAVALQAYLGHLGELIPLDPYLTALALPATASPELAERARRYLQHTGAFASSRAAEDWLARLAGGSIPLDNATANAASFRVRTAVAASFGHGLSAEQICLTPSGMAATYAAFRAVNALQAPHRRTRWVQLGWLYLDSIAILQKLTAGPAEDYLHHPDVTDLAGLERLFAAQHDRIAGVLAEVPTNPLIQTPALATLAQLCHAYQILLVVDPTIASPYNVDVLPHCDVVVNSLTKYTASEGDVILGCAAVSPSSPQAAALRPALAHAAALAATYPRDVARLAAQIDATPALVNQINASAPHLVAFLQNHPKIARVHCSTSPGTADAYRALARGPANVGGVVSFVLRPEVPLASFYDRLRFAKGPSFGLQTTLICPFMYLAHYDLVSSPEGRAYLENHGLAPDLLRLSIGTEPLEELIAALAEALAD
jgi:cystathionine gamma-synthase